MADEINLTEELDAADALVLHDVATVTEWGVRLTSGCVQNLGCGEDAEMASRRVAAGMPRMLVRRTVTYGPWEEMPDA